MVSSSRRLLFRSGEDFLQPARHNSLFAGLHHEGCDTQAVGAFSRQTDNAWLAVFKLLGAFRLSKSKCFLIPLEGHMRNVVRYLGDKTLGADAADGGNSFVDYVEPGFPIFPLRVVVNLQIAFDRREHADNFFLPDFAGPADGIFVGIVVEQRSLD